MEIILSELIIYPHEIVIIKYLIGLFVSIFTTYNI